MTLADQLREILAESSDSTTEKIVILLIYLGISLLVGLFARKMMRRSVLVWTILSLIFSPFVTFIFCNVAGRPMAVEDEIRERLEAEEAREVVASERRGEQKCPSCRNAVNLVTRKGVTVSEGEAWRVSCARCSHELDGAGL